MRKAVASSFVAIALGALGVFAWHTWLRPSVPPLFLSLQISESGDATVMQGTPVFFNVFLGGSKAASPFSIGSEDAPWYRLLRLESIDNETPLDAAWSLLGTPHALTVRRDASGQPTLDMYRGGEAVLDRDRSVYNAEFGISPEESARIAPGQHRYRAILEKVSYLPWEPRLRVASRVVTVRFEPSGPSDVARLVESTRFYLRAKRFDDALRSAQQLAAREPNAIRSRVMLGDALNGLRRDQEALRAYAQALFLIEAREPRSHTHPDYLFLRIEEVQKRIKR